MDEQKNIPLTGLIIFLFFIAVILSGIFRILLSVSIENGLIFSVGVIFLFCILYFRKNTYRKLNVTLLILFGILFILCLYYAYRKLYNPLYDGMVTVGGGDVGLHVMFKRNFINVNPQEYHGFIFFYCFVYWIETFFKFNAFESFRLAFFTVVGCSIGTGILILHKLSSKEMSMRTIFYSIIVFSVYIYYAGEKILFPLFHYNQADGFYPHLFAVLTFLGGIYFYTILEKRIYRLLSLVLFCFFYRFSYGLNLGDCILLTAILFYWESSGIANGKEKHLTKIFSYGLFCVALFIYYYLYSNHLHLHVASIRHPDLEYMAVGLGSMLAMNLCAFIQQKYFSIQKITAFNRLLLFSFFSLLISILFYLLTNILKMSINYYYIKYYFHAVIAGVIMSSVIVPVATALFLSDISFLFDKMKFSGLLLHIKDDAVIRKIITNNLINTGIMILLLIFANLSMNYFNRAYYPYVITYNQQKQKNPDNLIVEPLADLKAWNYIDQVIKKGNKFRLFITPAWPQFMLANANFSENAYWKYYVYPDELQDKSGCTFWSSGDDADEKYKIVEKKYNAIILPVIKKLDSDDKKYCWDYKTRWSKNNSKLCYSCY